MNDHELDTLLRASRPDVGHHLEDPAVQDASLALRGAIVTSGGAIAPRPDSAPSTPRGRNELLGRLLRAGPRRTASIVFGASLLALAGGIGINHLVNIGPSQAWSASALRFAESSPRILIAGDDYRVSRATQSTTYSEMTFVPRRPTPEQQLRVTFGSTVVQLANAQTGVTADVHVFAPNDLQGRIAAALATPGARDLGTAPVEDSPARWLQLAPRRYVALWVADGYTFDARVSAPALADAQQLLKDNAGMFDVTHRRGTSEVQLSWMSRSLQARRDIRKSRDVIDLGTTPAMGRTARWVKYRDANRFRAQWVDGRFLMEVDGVAADQAAFAALLARMHSVDVDTWLRAMPASVVAPDGMVAATEQLLRGVPLPPAGWRPTTTTGPSDVQDSYQLGASVYGGVTCGWLDEWVLAKNAGDATRVRAAVDAMASSRRWTGLVTMRDEGAFPDVVWEYADVLAGTSPTVPAGGKLRSFTATVRGVTVVVPAGLGRYTDALGCRTPAP